MAWQDWVQLYLVVSGLLACACAPVWVDDDMRAAPMRWLFVSVVMFALCGGIVAASLLHRLLKRLRGAS
jgi:cytochrome c oxidase subunit IV